MNDTYKHKGLRRKLIEELKEKGIVDKNVLDAMERIPRHLFLDTAFLNFAYEDKAFPIGAEQTISHPYTVAFQSSLLNLKKGEKVLEIGTGCGYQTAVLLELGAKVFSIERQKLLYDKTKVMLPKIGYKKAKLFYGDGYKGQPNFAPFDKIIVTAGAPYIPEDLKQQLTENGRLIIPVGEGKTQIMHLITKTNGTFKEELLGNFKFVPLLKNKQS